jgi:hypothetical protein
MMADALCPTCGKSNPPKTQICEYCGARMEPSIRPGDQPVKKVTSEFERVSLPGGKTPIRPGDSPTKKDTGELEKGLPTWLQDARKGEETPAAPPPDADLPAASEPAAPPEAVPGELPDWLAGLKSGVEDEEEVPEWLTGIRNKLDADGGAPPSEEPPVQPAGEEWLSRLGEPAPEGKAAPAEEAAPAEGLPSWLTGREAASPGPETPAAGAASDPEWLSRLKEENAGAEAGSEVPPAAAPDWLESIPAAPSAPAEETPVPPAPSETPDWLKQLQADAANPPEAPAAKPFKTGSLPPVGEPAPDWLSQLQAETAQEPDEQGFQPAAAPMKDETPAGPAPDWLAGAEEAGAAAGGPSALIQNREAAPQDEAGTFSMEDQPDWLSTLKPEQAEQAPAPQAETGEAEETPESLEKAELPSWVQAMRPVEAVVADVKTTPLDTDQPAEQRGPLAGLRGVLPPAAGMGALRKPPAYSIKLQVGESQQQHAAHLERIIANEAEPQPIRNQARLFSARLLRWVIALALLVVIGGTIVAGGNIVPASPLMPSELLPTMKAIGDLPSSSPVLVVFDYQPALSGEMEAAAAPLIDHLLFSGARLTLLSTSPTGPALAERFLKNTQAEHYQAGQQYVNLGYLAGGPAGILDFAQNPAVAAPYSLDGQPAWQTPSLQGVRQFSDFAAVIVLTDDPDIGRNWIEQAGAYLDGKPMLMVISAQAEPMIRPYYDSGQLKGLVSGLAGGRAYGQATQRPGPAGAYWDAFSAGMLAAEIMIVVGAVWSAISAWRERRLARQREVQP